MLNQMQVYSEKLPNNTNGVVRSRKSKKDRQYNGQKKKKHWSTKHYTEQTTNDWAIQNAL